MNRLIVGVDDSIDAEHALQWAANVAESFGAELVAVAPWTPQQAELPPSEADDEHQSLREVLNAMIRSLPTDCSARTEVVDGDPAEVVLTQGDLERASLLVVGVPGGGHSPGAREGSVARKLAHHARRPLAVVPESSSRHVERIVLALDGSNGSAAAASWCAVLASALGAAVIAVNVYNQPLEVRPEADPNGLYQYFRRSLNGTWIAPLQAAGVEVRTEIVHEIHVAESLVDVAQRYEAEMIVVGVRGLGRFTHLRRGGVAMRLLDITPITLALVPAQSMRS